MKTKKRKQKNNGKIIFYVVLLFIFGFIFFQFFQKQNSQKIASENTLQLGVYNPLTEPQETPKINEPDKPVGRPTKSPISPDGKPKCEHDNGQKIGDNCTCSHTVIICENYKCKGIDSERSTAENPLGCESADSFGLCDLGFSEGDGSYCVAKPIVYLYPEKPTFIDVQVISTGQVVISDPLYPSDGWKQVLAYPNGNLSYQGKQYRELFYETDVDDFQKPKNGINISRDEIEPKLQKILTVLGLNEFERSEFMDFWVPILKTQQKPYIQFSLIQGEAKAEIDTVIIEPKPDTFIEILVYFKPLEKPFEGPKLEISSTPSRIGFTAVEWGGVLDNK